MIHLPEDIRQSSVLTEVHFSLLTHINEIPVIDPAFEDDRLKNIFQYYALTPHEMDVELHKYAAELLDQGKVNEAWQVLLSDNLV